MFNAKALLFSIFGGDEMYVPKPGSDFTNIRGVLNEDAFISFVASASGSEQHTVTIKYPSGQTANFNWRSSTNTIPFGMFVPKGSTVTATGIAYGFYLVPASSVGGGG